MERAKRMGTENIFKLIVNFSLPAVIAMMVTALYNVVDRIFVGQGVGPEGIAAITVSFPAMVMFMAFSMLVGRGAGALVSIKLGEHNKEEAEKVISNALVLLFVIPIVLTVIGFAFLDEILILSGASESILPLASTYMKIILLGAVLNMVGFGVNDFIRSEGNPKMAMFTMLIGAGSNIVLDALFIFGFGMGIAGAAWATIISQILSTIWAMYYFVWGDSMLRFRKEYFSLDRKIVAGIFAIGFAPFSMQFVASFVNALFNVQLLAYGGDIAVAVVGILLSVDIMMVLPMVGIAQGVQPLVGYNYGAKKYDRVKSALWQGVGLATLISVLGFLVVMIFPNQIIELFGGNGDLSSLGVHALRIYLLGLPLVGFQIVGSIYFTAVGKGKVATFLSLSRQAIILIPLLLIMPTYYGIEGIWWTAPVSVVLSALVTGVFLFWEIGHLKNAKV